MIMCIDGMSEDLFARVHGPKGFKHLTREELLAWCLFEAWDNTPESEITLDWFREQVKRIHRTSRAKKVHQLQKAYF